MLIAIEGIDGIGKGTQSKLLYERLKKEGYNAILITFPVYSSFYGAMIGEYLNGKYGELNDIDPKLIAMLYAADRKHFFDNNDLSGYDVVVSDRYAPSNLAHQSVKLPPEARKEFCAWIEQMEYEVNGIPRPDLTFILDADTTISSEYVKRKKKRDYTDESHDLHEKNTDYLKAVRVEFQNLGKQDGYTYINCQNGTELYPIETISDKIMEIVKTGLNR